MIAVLAVGVVLSCWLGYGGYPVPRGDDDFYKSPAAELATKGRLTIPCLRGFLPHAEEIFASYPQGYQVLLSGWYLVFGFSLRSTLAYSFSVHVINAMLISIVTARILRDNIDLSQSSRSVIVAATGLVHIANVAYFDRPEETALIFIWLEILWFRNSATGSIFSGSLASGILLGLAALIAPWVGVLGALVVVFRQLFLEMQAHDHSCNHWMTLLGRLGVAGGCAATMTMIWYAVMNHLYPGVVQEQLAAVFGFIHKDQMLDGTSVKLVIALRTLLFNPRHILVTVIVVMFFPMFIVSRGWRQTNPLSMVLYAAAITSILFCALTRPSAYTYLGASQMLLLPCFGPTVSRYTGRSAGMLGTRLGFAVLILCVVYAFTGIARLCYQSFHLPTAERPDAVFSRLREIIPPGASVATTSRHWYAFQGRNAWLDAYWCSFTDPPEALKCEWMVLFRGFGVPESIDAFEVVEEPSSQADQDETFAYSVWRRKHFADHAFQDKTSLDSQPKDAF